MLTRPIYTKSVSGLMNCSQQKQASAKGWNAIFHVKKKNSYSGTFSMLQTAFITLFIWSFSSSVGVYKLGWTGKWLLQKKQQRLVNTISRHHVWVVLGWWWVVLGFLSRILKKIRFQLFAHVHMFFTESRLCYHKTQTGRVLHKQLTFWNFLLHAQKISRGTIGFLVTSST